MKTTQAEKDKQTLCSIFPDLIWLMIYGQLTSFPLAVESMFHTSVYFRQLLYRQRNKFLFPRVLSQVNPIIKLVTNNSVAATENIDPILLKLRLICNSWCQTVDNKMELLFRHWERFSFTNVSITPWTGDDEATFMSHFADSHFREGNRSPFIGNTATLKFILENEAENIKTWPFSQLLPTYGQFVRYCKFNFWIDSVSEQLYQSATLRVFSCMPNIKLLYLDLCPDLVIKTLRKTIPDIDLPEFQFLQDLYMTIKTANYQLTRELLSRMPNIRKLWVAYREELSPSLDLLPGAKLTKLENLTILLTGDNTNWTRVPDYAQNHPTLKQHECALDANLHAFFQTLEAHSPFYNLRTLHVYLGCTVPSSWGDWKKYKINLPNLATFLLGSWTWSSIDMILLFRNSLEHLVVQLLPMETFEEFMNLEVSTEIMENEEIKFLSCHGNLSKENNIWTQMPKLDVVTLVITQPREEATLTKVYYRNRDNESFEFN